MDNLCDRVRLLWVITKNLDFTVQSVTAREETDLCQLRSNMSAPENTAPTLFLLMAQYGGRTVVPIDQVCRDFFGHLTVDKLLRKALRGDLALPIVRIETSQKAQRGVHLIDLAAYIDKRREAAVRECCQLTGRQQYEFGTSKQANGSAKA